MLLKVHIRAIPPNLRGVYKRALPPSILRNLRSSKNWYGDCLSEEVQKSFDGHLWHKMFRGTATWNRKRGGMGTNKRKGRLRSLVRKVSGQGIVEFLMVIPVFLVLFFCIYDRPTLTPLAAFFSGSVPDPMYDRSVF